MTRHRAADRGLRGRAERHAVEPARRGGRLPADQRGAAGRGVPAVREPGRRAVRLHGRPVHARRGHAVTPRPLHEDDSYMRLTKTIDLTSVAAAQTRSCSSSSRSTPRPNYDHVIVEARTAGQDNWTTLPEPQRRDAARRPGRVLRPGLPARAAPVPAPLPAGAAAGLRRAGHVRRRGTRSRARPAAGRSVAFDLSAYAGQQVELSITYVTDPGTGGVGAFVDDTKVVVGGADDAADGFEGATSTWTVRRPARGQPAERRQLGDRPAGRELLRRHVDRRHAAARASGSSRSRPRPTARR